MVYFFTLFVYLFSDYNFLFYLNMLDFFNNFNGLINVILLPLNILFYIFLSGDFNCYKFIFSYSSNNFALITLLFSLASFAYLFYILYINVFLVLLNLLYNYQSFTKFFLFFKKKISWFIVADFLPFYNTYNPFYYNSHLKYKSSNINLSFSLFKSLFFSFKNKLFYNFNAFFLLCTNTFLNIYIYIRKPVWKPLSKKTSYFGLYNSFKNKY